MGIRPEWVEGNVEGTSQGSALDKALGRVTAVEDPVNLRFFTLTRHHWSIRHHRRRQSVARPVVVFECHGVCGVAFFGRCILGWE